MKIPFLTCKWTDLIVANFAIEPQVVQHLVPKGTELDFHNGKTYLSLVAFRFTESRALGFLPIIPAFSFVEINLRFYVQRRHHGEIRRGVTFIKEIAPSRLITWGAKIAYNEPYETFRTYEDAKNFDSDRGGVLTYGFESKGKRHEITAGTTGALKRMNHGTEARFILDHFWGYTSQRNGTTKEYNVVHPSWSYREVDSYRINQNLREFYGPPFTNELLKDPHSVFVAQGSSVGVFMCESIRAEEKSRQAS